MNKIGKILSGLLIVFCLNLFSFSAAQTVIYNPNSKIYHNTSCAAGNRCKSCVKTEKAEAVKKGARACKTCKG